MIKSGLKLHTMHDTTQVTRYESEKTFDILT